MEKNNIAIAFVAFSDNHIGKRRPILVVLDDESKIKFYKITSQFAKKSLTIQSKYFEIEDWVAAGLHKRSWIDTVETVTAPKSILKTKWIGRLSLTDAKRFAEFLKNRN